MTEDQLAINRNAITLQDGGLDLDLLLPDINWRALIFLFRAVTLTLDITGILTLKPHSQWGSIWHDRLISHSPPPTIYS